MGVVLPSPNRPGGVCHNFLSIDNFLHSYPPFHMGQPGQMPVDESGTPLGICQPACIPVEGDAGCRDCCIPGVGPWEMEDTFTRPFYYTKAIRPVTVHLAALLGCATSTCVNDPPWSIPPDEPGPEDGVGVYLALGDVLGPHSGYWAEVDGPGGTIVEDPSDGIGLGVPCGSVFAIDRYWELVYPDHDIAPIGCAGEISVTLRSGRVRVSGQNYEIVGVTRLDVINNIVCPPQS